MGRITLGLGSNLGDRRAHLEDALRRVQALLPARPLRVSPVYETPALLPPGAPSEWDRAYLNIAAEGEGAMAPAELLAALKSVESAMGRDARDRWAPRPIDIDIVRWEGVAVATEALTIPHPSWDERAFVLDPLKDLDPSPELLARARRHPRHAPVWMAILNVTPDSFSDGGRFRAPADLEAHLDAIEPCAGMVDVGAESTRPGARMLSWEEEWARLEPVLARLRARAAGRMLAPRVSVDTRHAESARRALAAGATIVNDVSGAGEPALLDAVATAGADYVLMHSLTIPADPKRTLARDADVMAELLAWFEGKLAALAAAGIPPARTILDPGIGFGKTSVQSEAILRNLDALAAFPCRILVGHSRKSFLRAISPVPAAERDLESIGVSLRLPGRGADILRVHDPVAHHRAYMGWSVVSPVT